MKKQLEPAINRIETTLGELVSLITDIAMEDGKSEEESYELTSKTLERILLRSTEDIEFELPKDLN